MVLHLFHRQAQCFWSLECVWSILCNDAQAAFVYGIINPKYKGRSLKVDSKRTQPSILSHQLKHCIPYNVSPESKPLRFPGLTTTRSSQCNSALSSPCLALQPSVWSRPRDLVSPNYSHSQVAVLTYDRRRPLW